MNRHWKLTAEMEEKFEWRRWCKEIPFLNFDKDWSVQVIPPFAGAVVRFVVKKKRSTKTVSVYMDGYENLGYFGEPHWEIYPDDEGNNARFALNDTKNLLKAIKRSLEEKK